MFKICGGFGRQEGVIDSECASWAGEICAALERTHRGEEIAWRERHDARAMRWRGLERQGPSAGNLIGPLFAIVKETNVSRGHSLSQDRPHIGLAIRRSFMALESNGQVGAGLGLGHRQCGSPRGLLRWGLVVLSYDIVE
jgi:hypothetical protein